MLNLFKRRGKMTKPEVAIMTPDERIFDLANRLFDELEKSDRTPITRSGIGNVEIYHFDSGNFEVSNITAIGGGWSVRGKRKWGDSK